LLTRGAAGPPSRRRFPTVERRFRRLYPKACPLPPDEHFSRLLQRARVLTLGAEERPFVELAWDTDDASDTDSTIWPVVVRKDGDLFFVAVPCAPPSSAPSRALRAAPGALAPPLVHAPGVSAALEFIAALRSFVQGLGPDYSPAALALLGAVVHHVAPFGRFLGTRPEDVAVSARARAKPTQSGWL
jgi:hypothetical protein